MASQSKLAKKEREGEGEREIGGHCLLQSNKKGVPSLDDENWNCWGPLPPLHRLSLGRPDYLDAFLLSLLYQMRRRSVGRSVGGSDDIPSQVGANSQSIFASDADDGDGRQRIFFLSLATMHDTTGWGIISGAK